MRIIGFLAENYMRIKLVEVRPKGRIVQFTGKNGQGKTSAIGAVWAGLLGKKMQPEKPVRKGSSKARIQLQLGDENVELQLERGINPDGSQSLSLRTAGGVQISQPQQLLNSLMGEMPGDPLDFMKSEPKKQVEILRKLVKLDIDIDDLNRLNNEDFAARTVVNREVSRLQVEYQGFVVQDGLPKEKQDEAAILEKITGATLANQEALAVDRARQMMSDGVENQTRRVAAAQHKIVGATADVERLKKELELARVYLVEAKKLSVAEDEVLTGMKDEFAAASVGQFVDASLLTAELQQVQLVNREIDKRGRRDEVEKKLTAEQRKAAGLTRAIDDRTEMKVNALASAKMPVDGLTMDEGTVLFKGIPLGQLGEAEQLRLAALIYMTGNPKLRVLPIWHGEALDDDNLAVLEALCEEHDFQIWMAKVDSSGTVGVVMNDGIGTEVEA